MGSKTRRAPRRASNESQRHRFPVGELARKRAALRDEYLSKSKELCALQKQLQRIKNKASHYSYVYFIGLKYIICENNFVDLRTLS